MSNQKMIGALPLAALFAALAMHLPPAGAAGQQGMVVVRDAQTGQMRAPTPAEMQTLTSQPQATIVAPAQPMLVARPDATRQVRMGEKGLVYSLVTRTPDGQLVQQCVQGERAADAALQQGAHAATHNQEHSHDKR